MTARGTRPKDVHHTCRNCGRRLAPASIPFEQFDPLLPQPTPK